MSAIINFLEKRAHLPLKTTNTNLIDVNFTSTSELGRRLSPIFGRKFTTHAGIAGSVKNYLDYLSKPGYPKEFLEKTRLTKQQRDMIPAKTKIMSNYWSCVAYGLGMRIIQDRELRLALAENTLDFTSYSYKNKSVLFGEPVLLAAPNKGMRYYLAILRHIVDLIKADKFNNLTLEELIVNCKDEDSTVEAVEAIFTSK